MSSDAVAAAYARYEADPTLANFEEAIHEGLKEVDWVVQSVGASFAETSTLTV